MLIVADHTRVVVALQGLHGVFDQKLAITYDALTCFFAVRWSSDALSSFVVYSAFSASSSGREGWVDGCGVGPDNRRTEMRE